jgi:5-methylcytosine-specific restriction protein B
MSAASAAQTKDGGQAVPTTLEMAVVRLGSESQHAIDVIRNWAPGSVLPFDFNIKCKQVPKDLASGALAFVWLGTNNNKGSATPWVQGFKAIGRITDIAGDPAYNAEKTVSISVGFVLTESLTKKAFIKASGSDYIRIADIPVLGINNYSSQVVQKIDTADESQDVTVMLRVIGELESGFAKLVAESFPELRSYLKPSYTLALPADNPPASLGEPTALYAKLEIDIPSGDLIFNELLARVQRLLKDGFGGVVLRGPPGTSKSWYARRIGAALVDSDAARIRFVQFHPSYQYEDFMEGMVADESGVFRQKARHFLEICEAAKHDKANRPYVLVIDELSRTDPARVFGEALTYLEASKRGEEFHLSSGRKVEVPSNLIIIATMNVWDRGVDEVDTAVERRFAGIALDPSSEGLIAILTQNDIEPSLRDRVVKFFETLQNNPNRMIRIGHAYFHAIRDESSMHRLWHHQLRFVAERAFALDPDGYKKIERLWDRLFPLTTAEAEFADVESAGSGNADAG